MVVTVFAAVAGDLADVVNGIRVDQCPTGFGGDQRVQITHPVGGSPDHGVRRIIRDIPVADDDIRIVDGEGDAVGSTLKDAQIFDLSRGVPADSVPVADRDAAVGLPDDDFRGVDGVGHTSLATWKCAQILHPGTVPAKSVRDEWRPVAEDRFTDNVSTVVRR